MKIIITLTDNADGTLDFEVAQDGPDEESSEALSLLNHIIEEIVTESDELEFNDLPTPSTGRLQ